MRFGYLLSALLMLASPALGKPVQYQCSFPYERAAGGGWIPEVVVLRDDDMADTVVVFDPIIEEFVGAPVSAKRGDRSNARITYTWDVRVKAPGQSALKMRYRLTIYLNGRPATITASPSGYDNQFTGRGTCKVKPANP